MIELLISYTKMFTRETLLGRLEAIESSLLEFGELTKIETTFSALSVPPSLSRSASTNGDYDSSCRSIFEEDRKIKEEISLLVRREPNGKIIFKCWTCNEFSHYASKCPKREKKY